jgi:hypothetical protein
MLALVVVGVVAMSGTAVSGMAVATVGSTLGRCVAHGQVLAHSAGAVLWQVPAGRLYSCVPASGITRRVPHGNASAAELVAAGHYVGFIYDVAPDTASLEVFDALTGHTELDVPVGDPGHALSSSEAPGLTRTINPWVLAPSGWIAEVEQFGPRADGSLTASNGRYSVSHLDDESFLGLGVKGSTLTWIVTQDPEPGTFIFDFPAPTKHYSAPLGPQLDALGSGVVPPRAPLPAVCSLLASTELREVLGPVTQASAGGACTYTAIGAPRSVLTATLLSGLSPAQVAAAKAADSADAGAQSAGAYTWLAKWEAVGGGVGHTHAVRLVGDTELAFELSVPDPDDAVPAGLGFSDSLDAQVVAHFADIAFDRLMGWAVRYVNIH